MNVDQIIRGEQGVWTWPCTLVDTGLVMGDVRTVVYDVERPTGKTRRFVVYVGEEHAFSGIIGSEDPITVEAISDGTSRLITDVTGEAA